MEQAVGPDPLLDHLMDRIASRDEDALKQLFDRTHRRLHASVLRIVRDSSTADDVIVESYTRVWETADRFDARRGTAVAWLTSIARRRAIDLLRSRVSKDECGLVGETHDVPSPQPGPEEVTQDEDRRDALHAAIDALPDPQRRAVVAAFFRGLTHPEVAELLGEPLGTVKTRIRAGLMALREMLVLDDLESDR